MRPPRLLCVLNTDNRLHYALSIALSEVPNRSPNSSRLSSTAITRPRTDYRIRPRDTFSRTRQHALPVGRVRIGGAGATIEIEFARDASHGRLERLPRRCGLLGEHYRTLGICGQPMAGGRSALRNPQGHDHRRPLAGRTHFRMVMRAIARCRIIFDCAASPRRSARASRPGIATKSHVRRTGLLVIGFAIVHA